MELTEYASIISDDMSKDFDTRVNELLQLRDKLNPDSEDAKLSNDEIIYTAIFNMAKKEFAGELKHANDEQMLQILTLLAETYVRRNQFRNLKMIAEEVNDIMRDEVTPLECYEETLPRIIEALGHSVYRHALFEIICRFLKAAVIAGADMHDYEYEAEKMLRLKLVLKDMEDSYLFSKEIRQALPDILSSQTLVKIIERPDPGHLKCDPIEYTRRWENIFYDVEDELDRRFANHPRHMGFCFKYWTAKRELLKREYGIEWCSPSQMNPRVMFD